MGTLGDMDHLANGARTDAPAGPVGVMVNRERRHRVVVIGAGFGGLQAVKGLADVPVDVVLIDANNFHTFQPLLYQVATAGLDSDDIAYSVRGAVSKQENADVRFGRVTSIDLGARRLAFADGPPLDYDELVVSVGAETATYGIPGVAENAFPLKHLGDALALRAHVLRQFERAAVDPSLIDQGALTVVIGGGGPTGVELAGGFTELVDMVLRRDFPKLDVHRARVVLVEPTDRLLGTFHPNLSARAARTLARRGVEIVLGADGHGCRRQVRRARQRSAHPRRHPRVDRGRHRRPARRRSGRSVRGRRPRQGRQGDRRAGPEPSRASRGVRHR